MTKGESGIDTATRYFRYLYGSFQYYNKKRSLDSANKLGQGEFFSDQIGLENPGQSDFSSLNVEIFLISFHTGLYITCPLVFLPNLIDSLPVNSYCHLITGAFSQVPEHIFSIYFKQSLITIHKGQLMINKLAKLKNKSFP